MSKFELIQQITVALTFINLLIQTLENLSLGRALWLNRGILVCAFFLIGYAPLAAAAILILRILALQSWRGLFNGGSDVMTNLTLLAIATENRVAFMILATQVLASYFISGLVKLKSKSWRQGEDLPVFIRAAVVKGPEFLPKILTKNPQQTSIFAAVFELILPIGMLFPKTILPALFCGLVFHRMNFFLFGLNRLFWSWLAAYPSLFLLLK